jgi:hypothetical protein
MGNLALTYSALGRHKDALAMQEKTLEFQRRVLPENHQNIGALIPGFGWLMRKLILSRYFAQQSRQLVLCTWTRT